MLIGVRKLDGVDSLGGLEGVDPFSVQDAERKKQPAARRCSEGLDVQLELRAQGLVALLPTAALYELGFAASWQAVPDFFLQLLPPLGFVLPAGLQPSLESLPSLVFDFEVTSETPVGVQTKAPLPLHRGFGRLGQRDKDEAAPVVL